MNETTWFNRIVQPQEARSVARRNEGSIRREQIAEQTGIQVVVSSQPSGPISRNALSSKSLPPSGQVS
jgi:hypothetical protein